VLLQGGHFDHADRLFDSLPKTFEGVFNNKQDVKELIPELFYLPDMLRNMNGLNLGYTFFFWIIFYFIIFCCCSFVVSIVLKCIYFFLLYICIYIFVYHHYFGAIGLTLPC
jgi:hypothetical protein